MLHADLNSFQITQNQGIITQLYTIGVDYVECWTDDVQEKHNVGKEFFPFYYLGGGLRYKGLVRRVACII